MKKAVQMFLRNSFPVFVAMFAVSAHAHAAVVSVPEIDPSMAAGGVALLGGIILMVRGRRR